MVPTAEKSQGREVRATGRPDPSLVGRIALVRRRTEAVFGASLDAMLGALDDLSVTVSSLAALAEALSPEGMAQLRSQQHRFLELGAGVRAKAERCRTAAEALDRLMGDARHRLDELRSLARTATLVSLNALVVSRGLRSDGGTIDGLARSMRVVLGEVDGLVSDLALRIATGQAELHQVETGADTLAGLAKAEALPAIADLAELMKARSRDGRIARSARLASRRFQALQDRVGQVVLHLQAGDAFRQRLEHVEAILGLAADPEHAEAAGALRRLAAAQILAAVEELGRSADGAVRQLRALGRTANDIPRAGSIDGLRSDRREGLGALVPASARIASVIGDLTDASARLTTASRCLADKLADAGQNAGEAAEFERRMTVLGLNAILLASRLGPEGRAMEVVAQQQRDIARSIIEVMAQLRRDLEGVVVASGDLDTAEDEQLAESLGAAAEAVAEIMGLSSRVRRHLAALEGVRHTDEIAELVGRARSEIEGFAGLASSLRDIAKTLEPDDGRVDEASAPLIAQVRLFYSMQSEREVHDLMFPRPEIQGTPILDFAPDEDDILFA